MSCNWISGSGLPINEFNEASAGDGLVKPRGSPVDEEFLNRKYAEASTIKVIAMPSANKDFLLLLMFFILFNK